MFRPGIVILILIALGTSACGGFDAFDQQGKAGASGQSVTPYGTCDRKTVLTFNLCSEAVGADYNDLQYLNILESSCESTGGIYSTNNCDRVGSLGTCVIAAGQANETHVTYYPPEYDPVTAQAACLGNPGGQYIAN